MTFSRTSTINWQGTIMEGGGALAAETGAFKTNVTFPKRIGAPDGSTSPEELIAAAHATCFAMVVAGAMGRANASTKSTTVKCTVTADKGDAGIKLTTSKLEVTAEGLAGLDAAGFDALVKKADAGCPISNVLRPTMAIEISTAVK
jgi:osmotically inducible protein OsmC